MPHFLRRDVLRTPITLKDSRTIRSPLSLLISSELRSRIRKISLWPSALLSRLSYLLSSPSTLVVTSPSSSNLRNNSLMVLNMKLIPTLTFKEDHPTKLALVTLITAKETSNSMHSKTAKEKDGFKLKLNFFHSLITLKPPLRVKSLKPKKMRSTPTLPLLNSS